MKHQSNAARNVQHLNIAIALRIIWCWSFRSLVGSDIVLRLFLIQVYVATQALKAIKTSEFMPFVVFISAPLGDVMKNMHEFAFQHGLTDKIRTVRLATLLTIVLLIC